DLIERCGYRLTAPGIGKEAGASLYSLQEMYQGFFLAPEFVEQREPIEVGADLIAGSLIKNPGGGLAKIGGYIAGRKDLIERCGYRLTAPGIGKEAGASLYSLQEMYQG
ncbi:hypothetical protein EDM27_16015, partial [Staphylococcus aureus]